LMPGAVLAESPVRIRIKLLPHAEGLPLPQYMTELAAGMDLAAAVDDECIVHPKSIFLVPTGMSVALPPGYEFQIRPRSGLALRHGLTVVNAPGTIDADYRGEIKVGLINLGQVPVHIKRGQRIAQMILSKVWRADWREVDTLPSSERGDGGFGHSGI
jgi:dUTP pyrophosphatase